MRYTGGTGGIPEIYRRYRKHTRGIQEGQEVYSMYKGVFNNSGCIKEVLMR